MYSVVKRGALRKELLQKLFFQKVWIILNISIYYHFFISHIVLKLSAFEVRLQTPFLSTYSVQKATLRVSGINSKGSDRMRAYAVFDTVFGIIRELYSYKFRKYV